MPPSFEKTYDIWRAAGLLPEKKTHSIEKWELWSDGKRGSGMKVDVEGRFYLVADVDRILAEQDETIELYGAMKEGFTVRATDYEKRIAELEAQLSFENALNIAKGCFDYGGGYRSDEGQLAIFHHGIQTVVNALEGAKKTGMTDLQTEVLHHLGSRR